MGFPECISLDNSEYSWLLKSMKFLIMHFGYVNYTINQSSKSLCSLFKKVGMGDHTYKSFSFFIICVIINLLIWNNFPQEKNGWLYVFSLNKYIKIYIYKNIHRKKDV